MRAEKSRTTYKVVVSIAFGLMGFFANFYPLDVLIPPNKASFVWGLVFPMLISLSWGWRYGLLSATLGLGAQTMWFLWLPKNGWAVLVAVPVYNGWLVWHGWWAERKKKGLWSSIYLADVPYRIFFAIVFSTVFSWSFRFNPSPWAPQMTLTAAPPAFIDFIQFKVILEGYMILLFADVLRNLSVFKRILLLEERRESRSDYIISGALLFGLIFWILSGMVDHMYSTDSSTLADSLILNITPSDLAERLMVILMCFAAGIVLSKYFSKYREAEAEALSQARKSQTYLDTAGVMLCSLDASGSVSMINPKGAQILGYEQNDIVGKNWFENYLPEQLKGPARGVFERIMAGDDKSVSLYENAVLARGNVEKIVSFNNTTLRDEDGNITGVLFSGEDITERKQVESKLLEATDIINRSPVVAFLWKNTEGWPVEFVSENVKSLFGHSPEQFMGGSVSYRSVIHPDDLERVGSEVSVFSSEPGSSEFKHEPYRIVARDGSVKWVEDITRIRRDDEGRITHYQGIVYDITERLEADARVKRSLEEKEVLLKEIHHRVKNNMAVISSFLSLQSAYVDDKKYLDMFSDSQRRIRSMALVHEKLYRSEDFAHINARDYSETLVKSIKESFAENAEVKCNLDVHDMELDIDMLIPCGLIINEILTNAFKYAFDETESPEISVSLGMAGEGMVVLRISDNGKGFPAGFDISKSAGLGLKIVNMLVNQIRGTRQVESVNGVTYTITFPQDVEHARHLSEHG